MGATNSSSDNIEYSELPWLSDELIKYIGEFEDCKLDKELLVEFFTRRFNIQTRKRIVDELSSPNYKVKQTFYSLNKNKNTITFTIEFWNKRYKRIVYRSLWIGNS